MKGNLKRLEKKIGEKKKICVLIVAFQDVHIIVLIYTMHQIIIFNHEAEVLFIAYFIFYSESMIYMS